jgi:hypothetical protein
VIPALDAAAVISPAVVRGEELTSLASRAPASQSCSPLVRAVEVTSRRAFLGRNRTARGSFLACLGVTGSDDTFPLSVERPGGTRNSWGLFYVVTV